jgi:hypothetical protein
VNNYGYDSKRRREKIYFRVYRSVSFFTGFVECQEQGLQQQNEKNEQYEHLLRKYRERFPDADKNQTTKKFENHLVHLVLDLLINFHGCTHSFFLTTPSSICATSPFSSTQPVLWLNNSFGISQHVGYRRTRVQLNQCANLLHRLGTPTNITVQ